MRALYIDPFSGISGNMFIGAMVDGGFSPKGFIEGLAPLGIEDDDVIFEKREKSGILATYFNLKAKRITTTTIKTITTITTTTITTTIGAWTICWTSSKRAASIGK